MGSVQQAGEPLDVVALADHPVEVDAVAASRAGHCRRLAAVEPLLELFAEIGRRTVAPCFALVSALAGAGARHGRCLGARKPRVLPRGELLLEVRHDRRVRSDAYAGPDDYSAVELVEALGGRAERPVNPDPDVRWQRAQLPRSVAVRLDVQFQGVLAAAGDGEWMPLEE